MFFFGNVYRRTDKQMINTSSIYFVFVVSVKNRIGDAISNKRFEWMPNQLYAAVHAKNSFTY